MTVFTNKNKQFSFKKKNFEKQAGAVCAYNPARKGAILSAAKPVIFIKSNDTNTMMSVLAARGLVTIDTAVVKSFMSYKYCTANTNLI